MTGRVGVIGRAALHGRLEAGDDRLALVEALGPAYHAHGHLPGAVSLPPDRVVELAGAFLPDRDVDVIVYGSALDPSAAGATASLLVELGYRSVAVYPEGKEDWVEAGLLLECSPAPRSDDGVSS